MNPLLGFATVYVVLMTSVLGLLFTREFRADRAFHRQISRAGLCAHCGVKSHA